MRVARMVLIVTAAVIGGAAFVAVPDVLAAPLPASAPSEVRPASDTPPPCPNTLVGTLRSVGFTGSDLREAWAIAMRESHGDPTVGPGHPAFNGEDFGLYQWNQPTFGGQPWFDEARLMNARYNARIAYRLSRRGTDWLMWGLDGDGNLDARLYAAIWTDQQIQDWIVKPFRQYTRQFDSLPAACRA